MKNKKFMLLIAIVSLFSLIGNVNAGVAIKGNNSYVTGKKIYCGDEEQIFTGYIEKSGKLVVMDAETNTNYHIWDGNNKCSDVSNQDYLDYFNNPYTYIETSGSEVKVTQYKHSFKTAYIYSDGVYDENETYYAYIEEEDDMVVQDVDENTENLDTYYVLRYLKSPDNAKVDEDTIYYEYESELGYNFEIYSRVTESITEDDVVEYYVETTLEDLLVSETKYEYDEDIYNDLSDKYDQVSIEVYDGKMYAIAYKMNYETSDISSITYFDEDGNEIKDFKNCYVFFTDSYKVVYKYFDKIVNIYDKNSNEFITKIEMDDNYSLFSMTYDEVKGDLYLVEYDDDYNFRALYLKAYTTLEGINQEYNDQDLTIKFSGNYVLFDKILINGELLSKDNYSSEQGSTIITLNKEYLSTLKSGTYTLTAVYTDGGKVSTTFTIKENIPNTGDNLMMYLMTFGISISCIGLVIISLKKKQN